MNHYKLHLAKFFIITTQLLGIWVSIIGILFYLGYHLTGTALFSIFITSIFILVILILSTRLMQSDISRKNIECQGCQSYEEIEDLYNHAPCGYHSLDEDGIFTRINATELEWLGYVSSELLGKIKFSDLLTSKSRKIFQKKFENFKNCGLLHSLELELIRKNGSIMAVLLNATSSKHPNKYYLMDRVTIFDITERKRIDQALRLSEERFRNTMNVAPIGMAIMTLEGKYVEVNKSLCQIVGYSKSELEKMSFQEITYSEDLTSDLINVKKLIEGKIRLHQTEKRYVRKDGKVIWVQLTASLLKDSKTDKPLFFITQIEDITERKQTEEMVRILAYHDTLTNLPNRRSLSDSLNHMLASAKRHQHVLAVMFLDLDKFKHINDSLGHEAGDELLKAVAVRLSAALRLEDIIARISGDEFVIVLNEISHIQDAAIVANKIIDSMKKPFLIMGHEIETSISIGIAIFPKNGTEAKELIRNADSAMYVAKESGRNQYKFY